MSEPVSALQQVALVNVELSSWSGYKRTSDEELAKIGVNLPKGSPLTKGGKKIFPTEYLTDFGNIRKEIGRRLSRFGVRALGGTAQAVPESAIDEITVYLDEVKARTNRAIADFEQYYDIRMDEYIKSIPDPIVKSIISASALKKDDAVSKFGISWQIFKIVPAGDAEENSKSLVSGMANTLFEEVTQAAVKIYEDSFKGKPQVTQKALHQVRALRDKMAGLSFLDPINIDSIVKSLDTTLSSLPAKGWIGGSSYELLVSVLMRMKNPEEMLQHAALIREGESIQGNLNQSAAQAIAPSPETTATIVGATQPEIITENDLSGNLFADVVVTEPAPAIEAISSVVETITEVTQESAPVVVSEVKEVVETTEPGNVIETTASVVDVVAEVIETAAPVEVAPVAEVAVETEQEPQIAQTSTIEPEVAMVETDSVTLVEVETVAPEVIEAEQVQQDVSVVVEVLDADSAKTVEPEADFEEVTRVSLHEVEQVGNQQQNNNFASSFF